MKNPDLIRIESVLKTLPPDLITYAKKLIAKREESVETAVMAQETDDSVKECPRCGCKEIAKWGYANGKRRFKCLNEGKTEDGSKACGKTFNALTGTPLARLRLREKHLDNAACMLDGLSVRKTARRLGVNKKTAFRWRHRFLEEISKIQPAKLSGAVEADETFFRMSFKGQRGGLPRKAYKRGTKAELRGLSRWQVPVLVARDRSTGETLSIKLPSRSIAGIEPELAPRLAPDSTLYCDGYKAYRKIAQKAGFAVKVVKTNPKHITSGPNHLNNVNNFHQRLKSWLFPFQGVASKYLGNYVGWHRWIESRKRNRKGKAKDFLLASIAR
jgi:transposase-like protein